MHPAHSIHIINRRRHHRASTQCDVQIQAIDSTLPHPDIHSAFCHACDISISGVKLLVRRPYPIDTHLLMTIECKENGWTRITSRAGSVVWSQLTPDEGQCLLGIKFSEVHDQEEDAIAL